MVWESWREGLLQLACDPRLVESGFPRPSHNGTTGSDSQLVGYAA
jgi:hypothetical protein